MEHNHGCGFRMQCVGKVLIELQWDTVQPLSPEFRLVAYSLLSIFEDIFLSDRMGSWWCARDHVMAKLAPPRYGTNFFSAQRNISKSTTKYPTMNRIVPQRARMLWGHAPRVRSHNRVRRSFATVSGAERYDCALFLILEAIARL